MVEEFNIQITNLNCPYRRFGICSYSENKIAGSRNPDCSSDICKFKV